MERLDPLIDATLDFSRLIRRRMAEQGHGTSKINMLQMHGLSLILEKDGMTMRELADLLKIMPSTASVFVGRLVKSGLVRREADTVNRTFVHLHLTKEGERILKEGTKMKHDILRQLFSVVSAQDRATMERIFTKLVSSISDR